MARQKNTPSKPRNRAKSAHIWQLVTNQQNLSYMLAAGMVMGPAGFQGKHYDDLSNLFPGRIPLFRRKVRDKAYIPARALDQVSSERKHLLPCIAAFDLEHVSGPARMLLRDGRMRDVASPTARKHPGDIAILLPAPLPISLLSGISFRSSAELQAFASTAADVSNIDLSLCRTEVDASLFLAATDVTWPPMQRQAQLLEPGNDNPLALGQAAGGVLAMLYHAANRSDLGVAVFRLVTGCPCDQDKKLMQQEPLLAGLPGWLNGTGLSGTGGTENRLFWGVVQSLVTAQAQQSAETPVDVALAYLQGQLEQLQATELRAPLERLIADMGSCRGLGGGTITELLARHKGSLARPLLLFCLREHCLDLLEFSRPLLRDAEYILASILFGVRDGWLRLPRAMRHPDLSAYVAWRMAETEQREHGGLLMLHPPSPPTPLRAFFPSATAQWNPKQEQVALELARECGWAASIVTRITLAPGSDLGSVESSGLQLGIHGQIMSATEAVNREQFLNRLGQWPPAAAGLQSMVSEKLGNPDLPEGH